MNFKKKNIRQKGSAFIIAIMISIVLSLMLSGLYVVTNSTTTLQKDDSDRKELYWAAQSGANYNVDWFKHQTSTVISDPTVQAFSEELTNEFVDINISLARERYSNSAGRATWNLISTATDNITGLTCTINLDNIWYIPTTGNGILGHAEVMFANAAINKQNFTSQHSFYGSTYFEEYLVINFQANDPGPIFYGKVFSAFNTETEINGKQALDATDYSSGISIVNNMSEEIAHDTLQNYTFRQGYWKEQDPLVYSGITETWNEINAHSDVFKLSGGSGDVTIVLSYDEVNDITTAKINGTSTITISNSDYRGIAIPNTYGTVLVEGESNSDLSIVTESSDIEIVDDFYVHGMSGFTNINHEDVNEAKLKELYDEIQLGDKARLALIAGLGVGEEAKFKLPNGNSDNILVTAAMFLPKGDLDAATGSCSTNLINVGPYIILNPPSKESAAPSQFFNFHRIEDYRYTSSSFVPPFFIPGSTGTGSYDVEINDDYEWSISWN